MPGAGSDAPNRYTTMMPSVNRSFLRRSGVRNAWANIASLATDPKCRRPGGWFRRFGSSPFGSAELHRPAGHAEPEAVDDGALGVHFVLGRAEGDEQRGEVLGARVGQAADRGLALEVEHCVDVARLQRLAAPVVELGHDRGDYAVVAGDRAQVVGEEAAADDEHA